MYFFVYFFLYHKLLVDWALAMYVATLIMI